MFVFVFVVVVVVRYVTIDIAQQYKRRSSPGSNEFGEEKVADCC